MPKFRVYRHYVGCHVYDVEAETAQAAHEELEQWGEAGDGVEFLHEANEPSENLLFTLVHTYEGDDWNADHSDEPSFVFNSAALKLWNKLPPS